MSPIWHNAVSQVGGGLHFYKDQSFLFSIPHIQTVRQGSLDQPKEDVGKEPAEQTKWKVSRDSCSLWPYVFMRPRGRGEKSEGRGRGHFAQELLWFATYNISFLGAGTLEAAIASAEHL